MKNFVAWLFVAVFIASSAATAIHIRSLRESGSHFAHLQPLYERLAVFPELRLSMEKYRRASGNFRKMYNAEITEHKSRVREEMTTGLGKLDQLDPTDADRSQVQAVQGRLEDLLRLSDKYEPQLYLKDAYQKPDVLEAHEEILKDVNELELATQRRLSSESTNSTKSGDRSTRLMISAEVAILVLVLSMMVRMYVSQSRPIRRLARYAEEVALNQTKTEIPKRIPAVHERIAQILAGLAAQGEALRDQRRKFIEDVIDDLRPGLGALKRSTDVDEAVSILSASLEDLKQVSEISRIDQKMNPAVVDFSELVVDVCKRASRAGLCPEVRVTVPELPTWVRMDAPRMERAMTQVLAKIGETLEKGQTIEAILQVRGKSGLQGLDVTFHSSGQKIAGSPEQEIGKHWISQRGLALMLAQKVAKAHDGGIFAAGLIGSSVQISMKFSKSILTDGLVAPSQPQRGYSRNLEPDNFNAT